MSGARLPKDKMASDSDDHHHSNKKLSQTSSVWVWFFSSILPSKNRQQPYVYICSLSKASSALPAISQSCQNSTAAPGPQERGATRPDHALLAWAASCPAHTLLPPGAFTLHSCLRLLEGSPALALPCPGLGYGQPGEFSSPRPRGVRTSWVVGVGAGGCTSPDPLQPIHWDRTSS